MNNDSHSGMGHLAAHYKQRFEVEQELAETRERALADVKKAYADLTRRLNTPELDDFANGVVTEAQHQRERWGSDHDAGKTNADWFWLIGYLAQKAMYAADQGDLDKAKHHCISTAAALANWHSAIQGTNNEMRPGISTPENVDGKD